MVESSLIDTMVNDALWETVHHYYIGITAENVTEKYRLSRMELDRFRLIHSKKHLKRRKKERLLIKFYRC